MEKQPLLSEILRKKGIGPNGSKSLDTSDLSVLPELLSAPECSLTTKATLLTALLMLPPTEAEAAFLEQIRQHADTLLPRELVPFLGAANVAESFLATVLRVVAHENLSAEEAEKCFRDFFEQPAYLQASFLEAQRLKRETYEENMAFLRVLQQQVPGLDTELPCLIDFGDSYDGHKRYTPLNLFVACVLAAAGYPCLLHGTENLAPKQGLSHKNVLQAAQKDTLLSPQQAAQRLADARIGWAYLDQSVYHPQLRVLQSMRSDMVKRPFLATFEKMLQPIRAHKNYLLTQYTHKHYKGEIARLVAAHTRCERALHLKGLEGSTMLQPTPTEAVLVQNGQMQEVILSGANLGFVDSLERSAPTAQLSLQLGLEALQQAESSVSKFVQYQCVTILTQLIGLNPEEAVVLVNNAIRSGRALESWNNA